MYEGGTENENREIKKGVRIMRTITTNSKWEVRTSEEAATWQAELGIRSNEDFHLVHMVQTPCARCSCYLYNNQINAHALIGQSAVGYCAGKPTEKWHVF